MHNTEWKRRIYFGMNRQRFDNMGENFMEGF